MQTCLRHSRPRHQRPAMQCPQAPHTSARPKSAHPMHRQPPLRAEQILKQKPLRHAAPPPESSVHPHTREQCSRQIQHGARCCPKQYCPCSCFRFQSVYAAKCKHSEEQSRRHRHEFPLRSRSPQKAKHVHRFLHPHTQPLRAARNQILCVNAQTKPTVLRLHPLQLTRHSPQPNTVQCKLRPQFLRRCRYNRAESALRARKCLHSVQSARRRNPLLWLKTHIFRSAYPAVLVCIGRYRRCRTSTRQLHDRGFSFRDAAFQETNPLKNQNPYPSG